MKPFFYSWICCDAAGVGRVITHLRHGNHQSRLNTPHTCSYVFIIVSETPERCQKLTFQLFLLMQAFDFRVTCFTNFPFSVCFKGKMSFSNKSGEINCFCWKSVWKSLFFSFFFSARKEIANLLPIRSIFQRKKHVAEVKIQKYNLLKSAE